MKASVIVPIYNNAYVLRRVALGFRDQTVAKDRFEVLIVDDGSTDAPEDQIRDLVEEDWLTYLRMAQNCGSAAARNQALDRADGDLIVFSDGDCVPCPDFIEAHLDAHRDGGETAAVLGLVEHPPEMTVTPLMRLGNVTEFWRHMRDDQPLEWTDFRTTNISLRSSFLTERFDESTFSGSGFEDTDLGFRLYKKGMEVSYRPAAVSYHHHFRTPDEYLAKVRHYGRLFAQWTAHCDPEARRELHRRFFPSVAKEEGGTDPRELARRLAVNRLTTPAIRALAKRLETLHEPASAFLYHKLFKHTFLVGYREAAASLEAS